MQPSAPTLGTSRVPVLKVQPRYLPAPDRLETQLPEGHCWLLVEQSSDDNLASALGAALGEAVVRIAFGETPLAEQFTAVQEPVGGVIVLGSTATSDADLAFVREVFLLAGAMQPHLTQSATANPESRVTWLTVSRGDGQLGASGAFGSAIQLGGLAGLSKTLRLEWPDVFCRHIDVVADLDVASVAHSVISECYDANLILTETGWHTDGRMTLESVTPVMPTDSETDFTPGAETVFLVSGGGRGITAQCVITLAERYHSKFILVGRSAVSDAPEPAWAAGVDDAAALKRAAVDMLRERGDKPNPRKVRAALKPLLAQREIRQTLADVNAIGGQAVYVQADVLDADNLAAAVKTAEAQYGSVIAILHGAGVLADKFIQDKQPGDFDLVVGVKVMGLQNLLACVDAELKALVLFSSVAGYYGNPGQADYALANDILNKTAQQWAVNHPQCRVLALDWGPWDGGMVTPALKRMLASRNIQVIPVPDGTGILADALASPLRAAQYVIGSEMLPPAAKLTPDLRTYRVHRELRLEDNPFLLDHVIGGNAVLPTVCAVAWMANSAQQLYPGYHYFSVSDYRVFKGVVFDGETVPAYTLEITEKEKVDGERVVVEVLIKSETETGKPRFHYRATFTLVRETPEAPTFEEFSLKDIDSTSGVSLYDGETLFHGPSFRGIEHVLNRSETGLTMRCCLPDVPVATQGQFPVLNFNPYLVDVQLQSMLVWSKDVYGYAGLPLRIDGGVQYRNIRFGETNYATLRVHKHSPRSLVADVIIHDENGRVCTKVTSAEITLSERLNSLFAQNTLKPQEPVK